MNYVCLKGNVGNTPEIRTFDWGKTASFSLAISETYKSKAGEKVTETDWHNIKFTGKICDVIEKHVSKGDQLLVTGKIKIRKYTGKDGAEHWATEIICDTFEFCGSKPKETIEAKPDNWQGSKTPNPAPAPEQNDDLSEMPF